MPVPPPKFTTKPGSKFRGYGTLTKPEFNAWAAHQPVKPGGRSYQGYRTYLENNRQGRVAATPKAPAPLTYDALLRQIQGGLETPAQLEARANRMANQGVASQTAIIREEAKLMRDEAQRRMEAMAAAGRAAAGMNSQLLGMVGGEYNKAAQEISGLATNLGGGIAGDVAADTAQQNAGLAAVGAPALAEGGPAGGPGLGGATQQGVEAFYGGKIPSQVTGTAGEAAQFGLAGMVGAQNLRATQEAQAAFMEATHEADRNRTAALKELAAGRPQVAAQYLTQLQDAQRQMLSLAMGALSARSTAKVQTGQLGLSKKELAEKAKADAADRAQHAKEYAESVRQFNASHAEDMRQFDLTLAANAKAAAAAAKKDKLSGPETVANFMATLGERAFTSDFQMTMGDQYYRGVTSQPQGALAKQAENRVVDWLVQTYWGQIALTYVKSKRAEARKEFVARIRRWLKGAPLPTYENWNTAALQGK